MIRPQQLPQPPRSASLSDEDICRYIAEMCVEFRQMARRPRLRMVGYLLDMVRLEAEKTAGEGQQRR